MRFATSIIGTVLFASTAAMAHTGGSEGFNKPFDFISAWGVDRSSPGGMQIISREDCESVGHLCEAYEVLATVGAFEASGAIRDLTVWEMPSEYAVLVGRLEGFPGEDGTFPFRGELVIGDALFAGWLSTPTGYEEYVTGILHVVRADIQAPEQVTVGGVIIEPQREWAIAADGFASLEKIADALWEETSGVGQLRSVGPAEDCKTKWERDKRACATLSETCKAKAKNEHEACLESIGFWDYVEGAATGAGAGASIAGGYGLAIGTLIPGPVTLASTAVGGAVGAFYGALVGVFAGPDNAKQDCLRKYTTAVENCALEEEACMRMAEYDYHVCLGR